MDIRSEKFLKIMFDAFHVWWLNMGGFAWALMGVLLVLGVVTLFILSRWVWGGGLSNRTLFSLSEHYRMIDALDRHEHH